MAVHPGSSAEETHSYKRLWRNTQEGRRKMSKRRTLRMLMVVVTVLGLAAGVEAQLTSSPQAGSGTSANPNVLPPFSKPYGQTYSEWSADWWQWTYSLPASQHPLFDTADCSEGQSGMVWYLGGTFTASPDPDDPDVIIGEAVRDCTIPSGTALFFPIVNAECNTFEDPDATEADLRGCANFLGDHIQDLQVTIDGRELQHLGLYRAESPLMTLGPLPEDNIVPDPPGAPAGATANSVGDGFFIMLAPLSKGRHEIHFEGAAVFTVANDGFDFTFRLDITYHLTVEPRRRPLSGGTGILRR